MVKGTKNSILWETICNNGGLLWSNIKHSVIIFSMKVHNCITWLQMILRNIFPIAVKEIPLAKSDITYNQSNAFSSYYYSMENNVFCFFRNVRREIYLGIGSLSVSCIGKYTFNHYIFHCSLVAIAKGNYFSSFSVLPTLDTVLYHQTRLSWWHWFYYTFHQVTTHKCGNFRISLPHIFTWNQF